MNEGKSAASFCHQVAALVSAMFCNFYLAKIHKIANNSATAKVGEKIRTYFEYFESLQFLKFFDECLTKLENYQILLYKISHRFLAITKLFSG